MAKFKNYREVTVSETNTTAGTTYIWKARIPAGVTMTQATAMPIWQVVKRVKTGTTDVLEIPYYAKDTDALYSTDMIFVRDDRATLTYDS